MLKLYLVLFLDVVIEGLKIISVEYSGFVVLLCRGFYVDIIEGIKEIRCRSFIFIWFES